MDILVVRAAVIQMIGYLEAFDYAYSYITCSASLTTTCFFLEDTRRSVAWYDRVSLSRSQAWCGTSAKV
jgi:hypothetical protein